MYVSSLSGNISSYSTKRIHGHQFFFQLLCHLFHTPHAPHFHSYTSIIIQTDIIYIVLSNPGSALHCVVSVTKAFRDQTGHVYGSTCTGVIAGRSMKTAVNYKVSNSKRLSHSPRPPKKNLCTQAHLQWALTEGDWFIMFHVSYSKS